jgi:IclR family transcriptional regulator, KDG regulon repressor
MRGRTMKPATTVTKVCRILDQFKNRPSLGITDLARSLQMLPSDVHRIVSSLQLYGYVEQNPETKRYHLGAGLLRLGLTTRQRNVFQEKGRAVLVRLSASLDAATHLALLDNGRGEVFLADQVDHPALNIFQSRLGSTTAIHSTALGKTIMAGMDAGTFQRALERCGLPKSTGRTITEMPALERELDLIRQRGYATDSEESTEGACCIGSPLRNCTGMVIGAISASMKASRFRALNQSRLASVVNAAAEELSGMLGYDPTIAGRYPHAS